ncbi:hypothetical protein GIB67_042258 [Kingdonia uniflora]|uniref:Protein kinase domain-containing protein n=1 Tax=Kingdonia uniflora TaxID=39325 RepID=A0A7J7LDZ3_9MAGN|nr:hypothetical protein GIB67_042258 [Kingdonia uniflora]
MLNYLCSWISLAIFLALSFKDCDAKRPEHCNPSSCGNLQNISYPFRLKEDPYRCGDRRYELSCENNRTVLYLYSGKYYVHSISYPNRTIQVVDPGLESKNCSSLPHYPLSRNNFSIEDPYQFAFYPFSDYAYANGIALVNCPFPIKSPEYVDTAPCINGTTNSSHLYSYVVLGDMTVFDLKDSCRISMSIYNSLGFSYSDLSKNIQNLSFYDIHQRLLIGLELTWFRVDCGHCSAKRRSCYLDEYNNIQCGNMRSMGYFDIIITTVLVALIYIGLFIVARALCAIPCFSICLIYKFRRRHLAMDDGIEEFLQDYNNLGPIRKASEWSSYSSQDVRKIKNNGQDFMSEVATIGRIHHVNIVQLSGFCSEGSKRALIYDFMPNGSLEKYIFHQDDKNMHLSWEKMYEIALGVARGIEYLHSGCAVQILHFDIKPHNILLDENFIPKISDFGLAKLYNTDDSIVTLTAARGTIGYIAPELFYKNIGGVSYKADVYSFGMLLMEMAGRRRNVNSQAENSSEMYFPMCVYEQLNRGEEMEIEDATEEERKIAKKLAVVALWCIQLKPKDRPSMNKVVEMLESAAETLQMPPKLSLVPEDRIVATSTEISTTSHSETLSCNSIDSISIDLRPYSSLL